MAYDISIKLPQGWVSDLDTYLDESGVEITHLSCHLPNDKKQTDEALIDAYVGPMPDDIPYRLLVPCCHIELPHSDGHKRCRASFFRVFALFPYFWRKSSNLTFHDLNDVPHVLCI